MAFLINNSSVISDTRILQNLNADPVPSIFDLDGWSKGTDYSRGGFGSWSSGTENLRTQTVQPTTNDFGELVLRLNCDLIASGSQNWGLSGVWLQFVGSTKTAEFQISSGSEPISSGSEIYVYMHNSKGIFTSSPYLFCESFMTSEVSGDATELLQPINRFSIELFDFESHDLVISWPSASTTTMSWDAQMFWK